MAEPAQAATTHFFVPCRDGPPKVIQVKLLDAETQCGHTEITKCQVISQGDQSSDEEYVIRWKRAPFCFTPTQMHLDACKLDLMLEMSIRRPKYLAYPLAYRCSYKNYSSGLMYPTMVSPAKAVDGLRQLFAQEDENGKVKLIIGLIGNLMRQLEELQQFAPNYHTPYFSPYQSLAHCNININNLLLDFHDKMIRLGDYGLLVGIPHGVTEVHLPGGGAGTPPFMSPEHLKGFVTRTSDVYVAVLIVIEMLVGSPPYGDPDEKFSIDSLGFSHPDLKLLLREMKHSEYASRPNPTQVLERVERILPIDETIETLWKMLGCSFKEDLPKHASGLPWNVAVPLENYSATGSDELKRFVTEIKHLNRLKEHSILGSEGSAVDQVVKANTDSVPADASGPSALPNDVNLPGHYRSIGGKVTHSYLFYTELGKDVAVLRERRHAYYKSKPKKPTDHAGSNARKQANADPFDVEWAEEINTILKDARRWSRRKATAS